jgi:sulfate adenylyltransferase subunit 2
MLAPVGRGPRELTHLGVLEAEAIHIFREAVAELERPVLLFSGGKDSIVMLHLAARAFAPAPVPFPVLHVDTGHNFPEVLSYRDMAVTRAGVRLLTADVQKYIDDGRLQERADGTRNPLQTVPLLDAIRGHRFDAVFGGGRRDEEKARAKERVFSLRDEFGQWDPRRQRPELWSLYNGRHRPGEHVRVFPLSNWTELDVWEYIRAEEISVVPLYFAKERPVVERGGTLIMVDDERLPLLPGETPRMRRVRFRTLGCYPLSGAIESDADTLDEIIDEMRVATTSERQGRLIDSDESGSMEKKKREGYF